MVKRIYLTLIMVVIVTMGLQSQSDDIYISDLKLMAQKGLGLESGYEREMAMWAYYRIHGGDGISINYNDAVKYLKKLSERDFGDVASENFSYMLEAYNMLGDCYEKGFGVTKDKKQAVEWWFQASLHGHKEAESKLCQKENLSMLSSKGNSFYATKDYQLAVECYMLAAEQGHAEAQFYLGCCYEKGYGVPQSYSEAVNWYRKAAEQGYAKAIEALKRLGEIK